MKLRIIDSLLHCKRKNNEGVDVTVLTFGNVTPDHPNELVTYYKRMVKQFQSEEIMKRVSVLLSVVFLAFAMAETSPEPAAMLFFGGVLVCLPGNNITFRNEPKKIKPQNQAYQLQTQALSGLLFLLLIFTSWPI
jgi:hypothetical protein